MMPIWLKVTVSIIGVLVVVGSETKINTITDLVVFFSVYGFAAALIFLPWVIKC